MLFNKDFKKCVWIQNHVMEKVDNGAEEYIAYATDGLVFHYNRDNDYYFPNTPISWRYVHELQYILRLCGLDELADNFKV